MLSKYEKKKQKRLQADIKSMTMKKSESAPEEVSVVEERKTKAAAVSLSRIFTDKDFAKIDAAQVKKSLNLSKSQRKRRAGDDITETAR